MKFFSHIHVRQVFAKNLPTFGKVRESSRARNLWKLVVTSRTFAHLDLRAHLDRPSQRPPRSRPSPPTARPSRLSRTPLGCASSSCVERCKREPAKPSPRPARAAPTPTGWPSRPVPTDRPPPRRSAIAPSRLPRTLPHAPAPTPVEIQRPTAADPPRATDPPLPSSNVRYV